jgi:hypothetical protein
MFKEARLSGTGATGSPLIHRIEPGSAYGLSETDGISKTASGEHLPQVIELVEAIAPQPGRLYIVNSALAAGEVVGFNLRGDWFTEKGLKNTPPGWDKIPVWDIDARRRAASQAQRVDRWGELCWGYPTFYNAHRFQHHQNKIPGAARGFILGAFWDDRMKRVILVSELVRDLCVKHGGLDVYDRIANNDFVDTSMGSKVPFDRCSICNHYAKTPAEYCEHVRSGAMPPYGMRALLADGRRCGVYNDYPRFFDDSFVYVGAERSAKVMTNMTSAVKGTNGYSQKVYTFTPGVQKLAQAEDFLPQDLGKQRVTEHTKWAEMFKRIPAPSPEQLSVVRAQESAMPRLPVDVLDRLSESPAQSLRTAAQLGIILRPEEFQRMMVRQQDPDLAEDLWEKGHIFANQPPLPDFKSFGCGASEPMPPIRTLLRPYMEQRSFSPVAVRIRIIRKLPMGAPTPALIPRKNPLLDEIGNLYHHYRAGLISDNLRWGNNSEDMPAMFASDIEEEEKIASAAQIISRLLLHTAYWPGLDSSAAEGENSSAEAVDSLGDSYAR